MAKKGSRLREFEKNHRVLDISTAQEERKKKKKERKKAAEEKAEENRSRGKKSSVKWLRLIGLLTSAGITVMVILSLMNISDLKEEEAAQQLRHTELLEIKEELLMAVDNINSDEFIEEQARKELKLVKGNELIFFFPEDWETKKKDE